MKYLIYGAGTIGITYSWLLSPNDAIDVFVKPEHFDELSGGVTIKVKDFRKNAEKYETITCTFPCVTEITGRYDGIIVAVNRCQLKNVLPRLSQLEIQPKYFVFMQNNWDIKADIAQYISEDRYIIAFPSSVGGGRDENGLQIIIFDEATRLGGNCRKGIADIQESLHRAGIKTRYDKNIFQWLKVHYLQQSITAGAVLQSGSYFAFAQNYQAVKKMVKAFRDGLKVCRLQGVQTVKIFPCVLFGLPLFIVARIMQRMFLETNTAEMVMNHMKKGLPEWIAGYQEVLEAGWNGGLPMADWGRYRTAVDNYLKTQASRTGTWTGLNDDERIFGSGGIY